MSHEKINISVEYLNNVLQCFAAAVDTQEVTNLDETEINNIIRSLNYDLDRMYIETQLNDSDEICAQIRRILLDSARYYLENRILK